MREFIECILNEYQSAKAEPLSGHPIGTYFRKEIPRLIYETGLVDRRDYLIKGSIGFGNWAKVPWICIMDNRITNSPKEGVYIIYLLSKNCRSLYLTLNQGCMNYLKEFPCSTIARIMQEHANDVRRLINSRGFQSSPQIDLGEHRGTIGLYEKGAIFYKEYQINMVPDEEEVQNDLAQMMNIYREYSSRFNQ